MLEWAEIIFILVHDLMRKILEENQIEADVYDVLRLYVERLIYPRFSKLFLQSQRKYDVEFEKARKEILIGRKSQSDFGIRKHVQSISSNPYCSAIRHLSLLENSIDFQVPSDLNFHFAQLHKLIQEEPKAGSGKIVFSRYGWISVLKWCIVHSKVSKMNEILYHYLCYNIRMNEVSYMVSAMNGKQNVDILSYLFNFVCFRLNFANDFKRWLGV
jgi:hypothetical protein